MRNICKLILSLLMLITLAGCSKIQNLYSRAYGNEIVFGSSGNRGSNTKAEYSGEVNKSGYERINWVSGDALRIYCAQVSSPSTKYSDYFISELQGDGSRARIALKASYISLKWGDPGWHYFSSLCPSPSDDATRVESDSVTCYLPDIQTYSSVTNKGGNYVALPNPKYMFLAGNAKAYASEDEDDVPIEIFYDPAITTFEFHLQNNYGEGKQMTVKSAGITTESGKLVGSYTVNVTGIGSAASADSTLHTSDVNTSKLTSSTVSMKFNPEISVNYGSTLTFTIFAHPGYDITKLTFWFKDHENFTRSFAFKYVDTSKGTDGWVDFTAFHKAKIQGLMAPESAGWKINMIPVVTSWNNDEPQDIDIQPGSPLTFTTPAVITWVDEDMGNITYTED